MSKYMISLMFFMILGLLLKTPIQPQPIQPKLESFKTLEKGPVLHPLRQKPYQRKTFLA